MANLSVQYMGLTLRNPIIVGSSGLTDSVEQIKELEKSGAGAVVLKSIFEEEITLEYQHIINQEMDDYESNAEYFDYYDYKIKQDNVNKYIQLIKDTKAAVSIPVIASVNCVSAHEWTFFAKKMEEAGADALELNVFVMPSDPNKTSADNEKIYLEIAEKIKKELSIPVAFKISHYFSGLANMIQQISSKGVDGLVLFNRFYSPDFDIDDRQVLNTHVFSSPVEMATSLRWVSIMADRIKSDVVASTGIHDGEAVIKQLLAGATAVQIVSALYKNGKDEIQSMLNDLEAWMDKNNYLTIDQFRGTMSQAKSGNPAHYERAQFMKYFSDRD